jgi:transcriptional regulator CtsR
MFKNTPIKAISNGHEQQFNNEQLVSMIQRLMDERDILTRENEYLKAKLNESILIETINEIRKERDLLLKLLLNLSTNNLNNKDEQIQHQNHHIEEQQ